MKYNKTNIFCICGCGRIVKLGNQYINGHNRGMKGKHHSDESKRKNREAHIGIRYSDSHNKKVSVTVSGSGNGMYGRHHSKETIAILSKVNKGKTWEEMYGIERAKEIRLKCKTRKRRPGEGFSGRHHSNKTKRKMAKAAKRRASNKKWQNPEFRERQLKVMFAGRGIRPTKPEGKLRRGLNKLFPGEYEYVGDGTTFIGGKNPDFINVNGQKKIIKMFGDYWHSRVKTGRTKQQEESQRIKHFAKYGFKTLIVWQKELKNISKLKSKLVQFHSE